MWDRFEMRGESPRTITSSTRLALHSGQAFVPGWAEKVEHSPQKGSNPIQLQTGHSAKFVGKDCPLEGPYWPEPVRVHP